jgi:hypothetical protein
MERGRLAPGCLGEQATALAEIYEASPEQPTTTRIGTYQDGM